MRFAASPTAKNFDQLNFGQFCPRAKFGKFFLQKYASVNIFCCFFPFWGCPWNPCFDFAPGQNHLTQVNRNFWLWGLRCRSKSAVLELRSTFDSNTVLHVFIVSVQIVIRQTFLILLRHTFLVLQ